MSLKLFVLTFAFILYWSGTTAQTGKYPDVEATYTKAQLDKMIETYQQKHDTLGLAYTYWIYGKKIEKSNQMNDSILIVFRKSMECFGIAKDSANYYNLRGAIGFYYTYHPFLEQYAIEYLESTIAYFRSKKNYQSEIWPTVNLANIYIYDNNYLPAEKLLRRGEALNKIAKNRFNEGQLNASFSDLYSRQHLYPKALIYAQKSLAISKELKIDWLEAVSSYYIARCLGGLKRADETLSYLFASQKISENNRTLLQLRKEIYDDLQNYYANKKNYVKGYEYAMKLVKTQNIIYFDRKEGDVHLSSEYRFLNEQTKTILNNELEKKIVFNEIDQLRIKKQNFTILLICLGIGVLLLLVMAYSLFRLRLANNRINDLMKLRDQFYTMVAHDLREPITSLSEIGTVTNFLIRNNRIAEMEVVANRINAVSKQTDLLLNNMLEWGKLNNYDLITNRQVFNVALLVQDLYESCKPLAEAKEIAMSIEIPSTLALFADPKNISVIIRNMIDNAKKNTQKGGTIKIYTEKIGNQIMFHVKDSGKGIAPEKLDYIQRFFAGTIKAQVGEYGLGLGLILMNDFAQRNNGTLQVTSILGIGSCFSLILKDDLIHSFAEL